MIDRIARYNGLFCIAAVTSILMFLTAIIGSFMPRLMDEKLGEWWVKAVQVMSVIQCRLCYKCDMYLFAVFICE